MDQKAKSGLLAVGIVLGMVIVAGIAVFVARGSRLATHAALSDDDARLLAVMPDDIAKLVDRITKHTFWQIKPTRKKLLLMVDKIINKSANTLAFVDDTCEVAFLTGVYADEYRRHHDAGSFGGPRAFCIDLIGYPKRPDLIDILCRMPAMLDRGDFESPK
ncbi:MAG TPA: hypothetical protein VGY66_18245 [Gemmataceae bacterium]|jgi:hypothetical protein|nr:hypothetical protein [Gemmataceae bacterium]